MASLEVELSCSVCRGFVQDLLPLTCGHSICCSCLVEWGKEEQRCPLCSGRSSRRHQYLYMALRNIPKAFQKGRLFTDEITVPLIERQANEYYVPLSPADVRLVLVGKTGSGKSASGNTILGIEGRAAGNNILGRESFESRVSPKSVTKKCQIGEVKSGGKTISVTDTPGVYDTELDEKTLRRELESYIYMTVPGPHVFLLVIRVGRYSKEEKDAVQWICDNFGKEALQYAMVLFTHTDVLKDTPLEQYVDESDDLQQLISDCGGRFHGFNNNGGIPQQVTQLLQKIEDMVESNRERGREYYTNEMYKTAQKQIEDTRMREKAEDDKKKRNEKVKNVAMGMVSGVGMAAVAAGGIVFGITSLLALPGLLVGAGIYTTALGVGLLLNEKSEIGEHDDESNGER